MANGIRRLVLHWAVSAYNPTAHILNSYHAVVDNNGKRFWGKHPIEANINPSRGSYAPHIGGGNTGSAGISMLGMHVADEANWPPGPYPLTQVQVDEFCNLAGEICETWGLDPTDKNQVATHGEFQPRRKPLEMVWLPELGSCTIYEGGDYLRAKINKVMGLQEESAKTCKCKGCCCNAS